MNSRPTIAGLLEPGTPGGLYVRVESLHRVTAFILNGTLDHATVPILRNRITPQIEHGARHLVFDLSAAEINDNTGLDLLAAILKRVRRAGGTVTLASARPRTRALLRSTGAETTFIIRATASEPRQPAASGGIAP